MNILHFESYQVDLELKIIALYMLSLLQARKGLRSKSNDLGPQVYPMGSIVTALVSPLVRPLVRLLVRL